MPLAAIHDWSDAYENRAHVPGFERYPPAWAETAERFRAGLGARARLGVAYGAHPRQVLDLFLPTGEPRGLAVIWHGGYWKSFSGLDFSHLAGGAVARGWAVAVPSYRLCPEVRIREITGDAAAALAHAAGLVAGPIRLAGHSAGGHLATRMACEDIALDQGVAGRISHILSISGLHDLRPLLATDKNAELHIDADEAGAESSALRMPRPGTRLTAWAGGEERPEFLRQTALIANIWRGLGAATQDVVEPGRHHFDVIERLAEPGGALTAALLGGGAETEGAIR